MHYLLCFPPTDRDVVGLVMSFIALPFVVLAAVMLVRSLRLYFKVRSLFYFSFDPRKTNLYHFY